MGLGSWLLKTIPNIRKKGRVSVNYNYGLNPAITSEHVNWTGNRYAALNSDRSPLLALQEVRNDTKLIKFFIQEYSLPSRTSPKYL